VIISDIAYKMYKVRNYRIKALLRSIICRIERGELYSKTLRKIFKDYHDVEIGLYTTGGCFVPFQADRFTKIGRYCSIARQMRIMNRNHPLQFQSTHALFCISSLGFCDNDLVHHIPIEVGNDVWIGHNAIIHPNVKVIGDGAVIAAGAVVNKNVPPYAIVVGNPARIVRYRFSKDIIDKLLETQWWDKSIEELKPQLRNFMKPIEEVKVDLDSNL